MSDDDAIVMVREWIAASPLHVQLLPRELSDGQRALQSLEISTRLPMGALAFHTGGLLVDHGWLRVLGAGSSALPRALDLWNRPGGAPRSALGVLIADDVLGGFFSWFRKPRTVHYLPPDSLEWEDMELGYTDWLQWALSERVQQFYDPFRWDGWQREVAPLEGNQGLLVYPMLFAEGPHIQERARGPVPVEELWHLAERFRRELRGVSKDEP